GLEAAAGRVEGLGIYRSLAEANPAAWLPDLAMPSTTCRSTWPMPTAGVRPWQSGRRPTPPSRSFGVTDGCADDRNAWSECTVDGNPSRKGNVDVDVKRLLPEPEADVHYLFPQDLPGELPDQGPLNGRLAAQDLDSWTHARH